ncbi:hypothetical protein RKD49_007915 [Streptomyces glaucescens]
MIAVKERQNVAHMFRALIGAQPSVGVTARGRNPWFVAAGVVYRRPDAAAAAGPSAPRGEFQPVDDAAEMRIGLPTSVGSSRDVVADPLSAEARQCGSAGAGFGTESVRPGDVITRS